MTGSETVDGFFKVCVKVYANEPEGTDDADLFVPIFHEWIRDRVFDLVLFDVADYAHAPDSPGIVLVSHEAHFAMDRSDGHFGILAQRRVRFDGSASGAIAATIRQVLEFAAKLEQDPRVAGKIKFDATRIRLESNDRLRLPNDETGYRDFEPLVRDALAAAFPGRHAVAVSRVANDPRDRLALEVRLEGSSDVQELVAA
ncbi:MAG: hypothetical protein WEG36_03040 [Gemmatimonadota bacterium]